MDSEDQKRKKAWKQRERETARSAFPLPNDLLQSMFVAVEALVEDSGCDHSHRFTRQWLVENQQPTEKVIGWLEAHGGFCDCEVSANAYDHWMQNR
jgi:Protein of unknown function (DUF2695)